MVFYGIHVRVISQELMYLILNLYSESILFYLKKILPHLPGPSELSHWGWDKMVAILQMTMN